MITEPKTDRASVVEDQKLRDNIESFERKYLDYRYPEVEDGTQTSGTTDGTQAESADQTDTAAPYI